MQKLRVNPEPASAANRSAVVIDRMTEHDLLEVVAIEETSGLSAWGWNAYYAELQAHQNSIMFVARTAETNFRDPVVAGFIVARHIAEEIHVNNFAVRPEFRRRGIGQRLLDSVLLWARDKKAAQAVLEVRAGNQAAQKLYERCGFAVVGRRKRYYKSPAEDALLMALSLE
jgi:[ribosomal protein S18]-alanine N-acetyltransferase